MESAKIHALQEALLAQGKSWGDVVYYAEKQVEKNMTNAQRNAKAANTASKHESMMKAANVEKKKAKFVNRKGQLKKIAKACKWECQGEKCWAHEEKACPYIHKNQKGSNKNHAVTLKKGGSKRSSRRSTRRRSTRRN
jgi:hypothetical protein